MSLLRVSQRLLHGASYARFAKSTSASPTTSDLLSIFSSTEEGTNPFPLSTNQPGSKKSPQPKHRLAAADPVRFSPMLF